MKHPITVTERNETYTGSNGKLGGTVAYIFTAPTHWADICSIHVRHNPHAPTKVSLMYGAGGCNAGVSEIDIADTLSEAFAVASALMARLMTVDQVKGGA